MASRPEGEMLEKVQDVWGNHVPVYGADGHRRAAAVLVPFVNVGGELQVLFEERASSLRAQPGEICFPGGAIEAGETARAAALRETCEELCQTQDKIRLLGAMDGELGPSGGIVWPYVGELLDYHGAYSANEVARVFTVPVAWLLTHPAKEYTTYMVTETEADFPYHLLPGGASYPWRKKKHMVAFYETTEGVIWGLTARILKNALAPLSV